MPSHLEVGIYGTGTRSFLSLTLYSATLSSTALPFLYISSSSFLGVHDLSIVNLDTGNRLFTISLG